MKILAIEREKPGLTGEDFAPHLHAEATRAWELYRPGVFREPYFRQDRSSAVLVLECRDVAEAEQVLATWIAEFRTALDLEHIAGMTASASQDRIESPSLQATTASWGEVKSRYR